MRTTIPCMLLLLICAASAEAQVTNGELGYTMTAPPGFVKWPAGKTSPDIVDCWAEEKPAEGSSGIITLCVQRLGGTLGSEPMTEADLGAPNLKLATFQWSDLEIEGVESSATEENGNAIGFVAQIPLEGEAVQLVVRAPTDQKARARTIMSSTLDGFIGESDRLSTVEIAERYGRVTGKFIVGLFVVLTGAWYRRRRRREAELYAPA
jgi:hypothetical protein